MSELDQQMSRLAQIMLVPFVHHASCWQPRLAEKMASASLQHTQAKVDADLEVMKNYVEEIKQFGERQARANLLCPALDFQCSMWTFFI